MAAYDDYEMLSVKKELANILFNKSLRLKKSFEQHEYTDSEIRQTIDDEVGEFMRDKFGIEWQENEQAQCFYETTACDMRTDLQYEMIDLYKEINQ